MTASLLVAASIAALLGVPQGASQSGLDVADASRGDSTRVHASKPITKTVTGGPSSVAPAAAPAPMTVAAVPASSAVPLPDAPLWPAPTVIVPVPTRTEWLTEMPGNFLADSIVVEKGERRMTLYFRGIPVKRYRVALGRNPVGDKISIGDYRTPEGLFYINGRNPFSKFYKSLAISYPDSAHEDRAARLGVHPGGNIMIHGLPSHQAKLGSKHVLADWTEGCIAVTNAEIDELWRAVEPWAAIDIKP